VIRPTTSFTPASMSPQGPALSVSPSGISLFPPPSLGRTHFPDHPPSRFPLGRFICVLFFHAQYTNFNHGRYPLFGRDVVGLSWFSPAYVSTPPRRFQTPFTPDGAVFFFTSSLLFPFKLSPRYSGRFLFFFRPLFFEHISPSLHFFSPDPCIPGLVPNA